MSNDLCWLMHTHDRAQRHTVMVMLHSSHLDSGWPLLLRYYRNWCSSGDHEPRVQRLGESGLNSVKEHHFTRIRHAVEGEAPCLMVQIHSYSRGAGDGYFGFDSTVPKRAAKIWKGNAPGLVCVSKATFFQLWPFIAQSNLNPRPPPFNLPVANSR